jgi:hypothetical protein
LISRQMLTDEKLGGKKGSIQLPEKHCQDT